MTPAKNTEARPCLVDKRGRVAIPKAILSSLGVKEGDYVTFEQEKGPHEASSRDKASLNQPTQTHVGGDLRDSETPCQIQV